MAFRVVVDGGEIICDTAQEAADVALTIAKLRPLRVAVPVITSTLPVPKEPTPTEKPRLKVPMVAPTMTVSESSVTAEQLRRLYALVKGSNQDILVQYCARPS
jgi:hypothetical protein